MRLVAGRETDMLRETIGGGSVNGQWIRTLCAAGLALVVLAAGPIACGDDGERAAAHLERAEAYRAEGKAAEATIEYRNALQLRPDDAAAHHGLALAYLATREPAKAYWEFHEAVRLDPSNLDARVAYGNFLLFGKEEQRAEALQQVKAVLDAEPGRFDAHLLKARLHEALLSPDEARKAYNQALTHAPDEPRVVASVAGFHVRQGERSEAERMLRHLVEIEPTTSSYLAAASFYGQDVGASSEAENAYRRAVEVAKSEERTLAVKRLSSFYFNQERFEDAEALLRSEYEEHRDYEIADSLAAFYAARGDREKADQFLLGVAEGGTEVEPFIKLSVFRGRYGNFDGAFRAAERALELDPKSATARLRKAELLLDTRGSSGGPEALREARRITDEVRRDEPDLVEAIFVAGRLQLIDGEYEGAYEGLARVVRERPDSSAGHLLLATALRQLGRRDEARDSVLRSLEIDASSVPARRLLARLNVDLGEHAAAIEEVRRILRQQPGDVATRLLGAQSMVRLRENDQARTLLEAIPYDQRPAEVHFALARLDVMDEKLEPARDGLIAALEAQPHEPEILRHYLDVERKLGNTADALERISDSAAARPDSGAIARLHGLALLFSGRGAEAEAELRRAVELAPNDLATYQALAQYYFLTERFKEGLATYEEAVAARPDSAPLHFALGTLYDVSGDREAAFEKYEKAVRLDPNLSVAKNNLAYLLAEENRELDRALDLAREAKQLLPDNASASDTLGWVLHKKGLHAAAADYFNEAINLSPPESTDVGLIRYHLALAYEGEGDVRGARAAAAEALRDYPGEASAGEPPWVADLRALDARLPAGS